MEYHIPALLKQSVEGLITNPSGVYVDVTFGGGGHSREILKHIAADGKLIAFDRDEDAAANSIEDDRFLFLNQNFRFLKNNLRYKGISAIDGLIADLGVSSHQFDSAERGFSFRMDCPLDMRMSKGIERSAAVLLNELPEEKLADIFYLYGELTNARQIAATIVKNRSKRELLSTSNIVEILQPFTRRGAENKFYAKVFQALRIEVNGEMEALRALLIQSLNLLKAGGRLAIITYHSLEDRLVKNFMNCGNVEGVEDKDFYGNVYTPFKLITRKGIVPDDTEIAYNNRVRSARLRIAEKR